MVTFVVTMSKDEICLTLCAMFVLLEFILRKLFTVHFIATLSTPFYNLGFHIFSKLLAENQK
jgi:hypothetical protein